MNYGWIILLVIIMTSMVGVWFAYKFWKKQKNIAIIEKSPPNEILEIFHNAENKLKGGIKKDGTTTSPYKILWDIARSERREQTRGSNGRIIREEQATDDGKLYEQPSRRQSIPIRDDTITSKDKPIIRKPKLDNLRRAISRIRRRNS